MTKNSWNELSSNKKEKEVNQKINPTAITQQIFKKVESETTTQKEIDSISSKVEEDSVFIEWEDIEDILKKVNTWAYEEIDKQIEKVSENVIEVETKWIDIWEDKQEVQYDTNTIRVDSFLDLEGLENVDLYEIFNIIKNSLSEDNMIMDQESFVVVSPKADILVESFKSLLSVLYIKVNANLLLAKDELEVKQTLEKLSESRTMLRNLEYIVNVLLAELDFMAKEEELYINYIASRTEVKLKSNNSFTWKGEIAFEIMKNKEHNLKNYKISILKRLIAYLKAILQYANQAYFLLSIDKKTRDALAN